MASINLLDYINAHDRVVLWWTSVGQPAGREERAGDNDWYTPEAWDHLTGTVGEDGRWTWDGTGRPTDYRQNSLTRLVAYEDAVRWESLDPEHCE